MSEPFIGEIRMFGGNFAPRNWAFCNGQLMSIAQNTALFSILGTTYGGNGQTTFALPDLRGRVPAGTGQGPGLPDMQLGEVLGVPNTSLTISNLPAHTHAATFTPGAETQVSVTDTQATLKTGAGNLLAQGGATGPSAATIYAPPESPVSGQLAGVSGTSGTVTVQVTGGSMPFSIVQPTLGINYIIAINGIFPSRN